MLLSATEYNSWLHNGFTEFNYINVLRKLDEIKSSRLDSGTFATWKVFLHTFSQEFTEKSVNAKQNGALAELGLILF